MLGKGALTVCVVLIAFPIPGRGKKPYGEVFDRRGLTEVQSYCIEEGKLSDADRYIVDNFLKAESKPKHLLTKMPWKLVESCGSGSPDAVAVLEFVPLNRISIVGGAAGPVLSGTDARDPDAPIKVVLTVNDSSQKLLYRTLAVPLTQDIMSNSTEPRYPCGPAEKQDAVYHVFWKLIEDLLAVQASTAK